MEFIFWRKKLVFIELLSWRIISQGGTAPLTMIETYFVFKDINTVLKNNLSILLKQIVRQTEKMALKFQWSKRFGSYWSNMQNILFNNSSSVGTEWLNGHKMGWLHQIFWICNWFQSPKLPLDTQGWTQYWTLYI